MPNNNVAILSIMSKFDEKSAREAAKRADKVYEEALSDIGNVNFDKKLIENFDKAMNLLKNKFKKVNLSSYTNSLLDSIFSDKDIKEKSKDIESFISKIEMLKKASSGQDINAFNTFSAKQIDALISRTEKLAQKQEEINEKTREYNREATKIAKANRSISTIDKNYGNQDYSKALESLKKSLGTEKEFTAEQNQSIENLAKMVNLYQIMEKSEPQKGTAEAIRYSKDLLAVTQKIKEERDKIDAFSQKGTSAYITNNGLSSIDKVSDYTVNKSKEDFVKASLSNLKSQEAKLQSELTTYISDSVQKNLAKVSKEVNTVVDKAEKRVENLQNKIESLQNKSTKTGSDNSIIGGIVSETDIKSLEEIEDRLYAISDLDAEGEATKRQLKEYIQLYKQYEQLIANDPTVKFDPGLKEEYDFILESDSKLKKYADTLNETISKQKELNAVKSDENEVSIDTQTEQLVKQKEQIKETIQAEKQLQDTQEKISSNTKISVDTKQAIADINKVKENLNSIPNEKNIKINVSNNDYTNTPLLSDAEGNTITAFRGVVGAWSGLINQDGIGFFTDKLKLAADYADSLAESGKIYQANLSFKNPLEVEGNGAKWNEIDFNGVKKTTDEIVELAKQLGHDGVIFKNIRDGFADTDEDISNVMVALNAAQIKNEQVIGMVKAGTGEMVDVASKIDNATDTATNSTVESQNKIQEELKETQKIAEQVGEVMNNVGSDKSNISSENSIVESQNKIQEELKETQEQATKTNNEIITLYRGVSKGSGVKSDLGDSFFTTDLESAIAYAGGLEGEVYKLELPLSKIKDFLQFNANGGNFALLDSLGNGTDEVSKKLINLVEKLKELEKEGNVRIVKKDFFGNVFDTYTEEAQKIIDEIKSINRDTSSLLGASPLKDSSSDQQWGLRTDDLARKAKANGYNGVVFDNIQDSALIDGRIIKSVSILNDELLKTAQLISQVDLEKVFNSSDILKTQFGSIEGLQENLSEVRQEVEKTEQAIEFVSETPIKDVIQEDSEKEAMKEVASATDEAVQAKKDFATANEGVQSSIDDSKSPLQLEAELMGQIAKSAREAADAKKEFVDANKQVKDSADASNGSTKKDKYKYKSKVSEEDYTARSNYYASIANQKLTDSGNTILGNTVNTELVDGLVKVQAKIKDVDGTWKTFSAKIDADGNMFEQRFRTITKGVDKLDSELENLGQEVSKGSSDSILNSLSDKVNSYEAQWKKFNNRNSQTDKYILLVQNYKNAVDELRQKIESFNNSGGIKTQDDINELKELKSTVDELLNSIKSMSTPEMGSSQSGINTLFKQLYELRNKYQGMTKEQKAMVNSLEAEWKQLGNSLNLEKAKAQLRGLEAELEKTGTTTKTLWGALKEKVFYRTAAQFASMFGVYDIIRYVGQGVDALNEFDTGLTKISYTMDMTKSQLDDLGNSVLNMASDMKTSIDDAMSVAQIYANMNTSAEEIKKLSEPTLILSNLSGFDSATIADDIQAVTQQFEIAADESMHIADVYDYISRNISVDYSKIWSLYWKPYNEHKSKSVKTKLIFFVISFRLERRFFVWKNI